MINSFEKSAYTNLSTMGVMTCPCKCILGIINGVILLAGLALAAAGGLLLALASNPSLANTLKDIIDTVIKSINLVTDGSTTNPVTDDFVELIQPAGIVLLVVGLFILAVSILGYCGLTCYTVILKLYVVVLIVILVIEVVVVAVLFAGTFNDQIQEQLQKVVTDKYGGIDDMSLYSVIPNILMIEFHCCGIFGYEDFNDTVRWNRTRTIQVGDESQTVQLITPIACCETNGTFPNVKVLDPYCASKPNNISSNWNTGCWGAISEELSGYRLAIILVASAVMLVQLIFIVMVMIIICAD